MSQMIVVRSAEELQQFGWKETKLGQLNILTSEPSYFFKNKQKNEERQTNWPVFTEA